jgi:ribose 5-phosphate isomerase A
MPSREADKALAAMHAVLQIEDGMVLGLGTGTTAHYVIERVGERVRAGLQVRAVPTSLTTLALARSVGIPTVSLEDVTAVDLTIDGADEVDGALRMIKGHGGALLREKVVACASRRVVIVADISKRVAQLGGVPLPVEVVPFARAPVERAIAALGGVPTLRLLGDRPALTDQGNELLDCRFSTLPEPEPLARALDAVAGLVEHGLFLDQADQVIFADAGVVTLLERPGAGSQS